MRMNLRTFYPDFIEYIRKIMDKSFYLFYYKTIYFICILYSV
jgi:hypothetical protein